MKYIVCVDDNLGVSLFNKRQSFDENLLKDIKNIIGDDKLLVSEYTYNLFLKYNLENNVYTEKDLYEYNYTFKEVDNLSNYDISNIIIYRWNRLYPSDNKLSIDLTNYKLLNKYEFIGTSHEKITREEMIRNDKKQKNIK